MHDKQQAGNERAGGRTGRLLARADPPSRQRLPGNALVWQGGGAKKERERKLGTMRCGADRRSPQ